MERWKINLYTIWCSQIISLMSFGFGLPFLPFYIQELGVVDPDQVKMYTGILTAAPAVTMGIMAPIWGMLADRFGKKLMLLRAMFCGAVILTGIGLATRVEHVIILRLMQGLLTGTITASSALIASNTPSHRLSYALGFLSSSTFIGISAGPAIGGFVAEILGYRTSFFIGSALMLIDFFLVFVLIKEDKAPQTKAEKSEISAGKPAVPFMTWTLVMMLVILFFMRLSRTIFNPYLPLYVQQLLGGAEGAVRMTGIINGIIGFMTAASGIILSRLGDKYNKLTLLTILLSAGIILSLPLMLTQTLWGFAALYGILFFATGGIEPIVVSINSGSVPPEKRGVLFGIQGLVGSIGWAVSPLIGSIVSIRFSIKILFVFIPVFLLFALITTLVLKKVKKNKGDGLLGPQKYRNKSIKSSCNHTVSEGK